jgi:hypothetical protein
MNDTTLERAVLTRVDVTRAFSWWEALRTPYTDGTTVDDWEVIGYKDVVCFQRSRDDSEAFLVGEGRMIHFGFDSDTLESAYDALGPRRDGSETTVVRRFPFKDR